MIVLRSALITVAASLFAGCDPGHIFGCTDELNIKYNPGDTTIPVGGQVTQRVTLTSCGGREKLSDVISWSSADTAIAKVNSTSGLVTGIKAGSTVVLPVGERYRALPAVRITVQ